MTTSAPDFANPFRPGAGHRPPYLAGRKNEILEFERLLKQEVVLENMVLTGLRGVGKTVLLDEFKPLAQQSSWLWAGNDLSESVSLSEETIATRLITDLAPLTSAVPIRTTIRRGIGFGAEDTSSDLTLTFQVMVSHFQSTPGLISDKLKAVLELAWEVLTSTAKPPRGVVFAYDEAQNLSDQAQKEQYPLSLLLDVFQSLQKKGVRFLLVLAGLPTLFPKLVEARTFAERMFRVVFLQRLDEADSEEAITRPINDAACPIRIDKLLVHMITRTSGGYPYFIQFICREVFDSLLLVWSPEKVRYPIAIDAIVRKLDSDFFAGRWARATDRQRELLWVIAHIDCGSDDEFTVSEVVEQSKRMSEKPFSSSHVNQMLSALAGAGLIYKNRYAKYSFAVPLLGEFIKRNMNSELL
jgi:hypothetical protein